MQKEPAIPEAPSRRLQRQALSAMAGASRWKPGQRVLEKWRPEFDNITGRMENHGFATVAVTGGVKVGKSTIANLITGTQFSPVGRETRTDHAIIAKPPTISETEIKRMFAGTSPEVSNITMTEWPGKVILVDTPDFDSSNLENRELAGQIIQQSDIVIVVGSREKSYTSQQLDWCRQWSDRKTFIFVHNSGSDEQLGRDLEKERRRQQRLLEFNGFAASRVFFPEIPRELVQLRETVWQSGHHRHTIQQSQLLQCIRAMIDEFESEYEKHRKALSKLKELIETAIVQPWQLEMKNYGFKAERNAFARKLTIEAGQRIGGPMGIFLRILKFFSPWALLGLLTARFVPGRSGKAIVLASSVLGGFAGRLTQAWIDKQRTSGRTLRKAINLQTDDAVIQKLSANAREAGFTTLGLTGRELGSQGRQLQEVAGEIIEQVMTEEIQKTRSCIDRIGWKIGWNLPLLAGLGWLVLQAGRAFAGTIQLNASYYLHALIVLLAAAWIEAWLLGQLMLRKSDAVGEEITRRFVQMTNHEGGGFNRLLYELEEAIEKLMEIRETADSCYTSFNETMYRGGWSTAKADRRLEATGK